MCVTVYFQGVEVLGNLNAPPAVTASAVIYALRCLLPGDAADVPLNQVRRRVCVMEIRLCIPSNVISYSVSDVLSSVLSR